MAQRGTPDAWHVKRRHDGDIDDCWYCQRARAICRSKRWRFATREEADIVVAQYNADHEYQRPMVRYACRWCPCWHMTTARSRAARRRAERQRRHWLAEVQVTSTTANTP